MMEKNKDGIVFLDKPAGETSFQSLGCIKKALSTRKVGHTGTLDKFATGLLIVLVGRFTKMNSLISSMDKVYEAEFTFGRETDTLDPEGEVIGEGPLPDESIIREKIQSFMGKIDQRPPQYSAVHIDGQRAYKLARQGVVKEMPSRSVSVYSFDILSYSNGKLRVRIHCSKGTYVRSLARDLGRLCRSRAFVSQLRRTNIGPFSLKNSATPAVFRESPHFYPWQDFLVRLPDTALCQAKVDAIPLIRNGVPFKPEFLESPGDTLSEMTALADKEGNLLAILSADNGQFRYRINFS